MNEVSQWIRRGADVREGLRLLSQYAPNPYLARIVEKQPQLYGPYLVKALRRFADEDAKDTGNRGYKFREEWPFLAEPDCPPELKILATDKITAYHNTLDLHKRLFDCPADECYITAKKLLDNFRQNRQITAEFTYYKENHSILGKHPVFKQSARLDDYRKMSVVELVKEQQRLKEAIWRNLDEIKKGTKPHLDEARLERVLEKRRLLAFVEKLLEESARPPVKKNKNG